MWTPDIIIASVIVITAICLRCFGINAEIWAMGVLAAGWLFGGSYRYIRNHGK